MKKFLVLLPLYLFILVPVANAQALVTVKADGTVQKNVLGEETDATSSAVKNITSAVLSRVAEIIISKVDAKVEVALNSESGQTTSLFDSSNAPVLEIENEIASRRILIKKIDSGFGIQEQGVTALTDFDVKVDPKLKNISLETTSGTRTLNVLPSDALETVIRAHIIDFVPDGNLKVSETADGELIYTLNGTRTVNLFNITKIKVPVSSIVSATSGMVESTNEPQLLKIFGFLFS